MRELNTPLFNPDEFHDAGGALLVAGNAGERFAVRNSGAAVTEGVGNHG